MLLRQKHADANTQTHTHIAVTSVPGWGVEFPTITVVFTESEWHIDVWKSQEKNIVISLSLA